MARNRPQGSEGQMVQSILKQRYVDCILANIWESLETLTYLPYHI